jgi:hypothetical protein
MYHTKALGRWWCNQDVLLARSVAPPLKHPEDIYLSARHATWSPRRSVWWSLVWSRLPPHFPKTIGSVEFETSGTIICESFVGPNSYKAMLWLCAPATALCGVQHCSNVRNSLFGSPRLRVLTLHVFLRWRPCTATASTSVRVKRTPRGKDRMKEGKRAK